MAEHADRGGEKKPREKKPREKKHFLLRLDPDLYAVLERWAADELRSVNAQIEFVLKDAARAAGRSARPRPGEPPADG